MVLLEVVSVVAFGGLLAPIAGRLILALDAAPAWLAALAGAAVGYLAADVVSGLVHWFCDRFFEADTPVIGSLLIAPFRDHHRDPTAMVGHGALELSGNSCLGVVPLLALASSWRLPVAVDAALLAFALAALLTNFAHRWAHAPRVPRLVARLQAWGVLLPAAAHAAHHAPGHRGAYCVTSGWANRWLDGWDVFARLERGLVALRLPLTRHP